LENIRNTITRLPMDDWVTTWVVTSHHLPNIGHAITPLTMGPIGTPLGSKQHICCKTVSLVLVVTANRTVNVLVLWGVEIKNIHNCDATWMTVPLWYKNKIKSGRKTANINTKKTLDVLSLLRPIVHDTSKTAKITWFLLVLHWAMNAI